MRSQSSHAAEVSVIVPARNEEACLGACLESLVRQEGAPFEVIVVDDGSTDRTRAVAESFPGVQVVEAGPLPPGWAGKCNAAAAGTRAATGKWLLFTDADTVHLPGSLHRSLEEAWRDALALLSYSPEQEVRGLLQWAVMPVIFAELAARYRPAEIADPRSPAAAANGQYLLVRREAYEQAGGHGACAGSLLEDVELARAVKRGGGRIRLRFGGDQVRARMYRSFGQLVEGWTKNLALLFPAAAWLAAARFAEFLVIAGGLALAAKLAVAGESPDPVVLVALGLAALVAVRFAARIRRAHFSWFGNLAAMLGLPLFSLLLLRSVLYYRWVGSVGWKGRQYSTNSAPVKPETATGAPWST